MWKIIQDGKSISPTIKLLQAPFPEGDPIDLTGYAEISACFTNSNGSELLATLTGGEISVLGDPLLGKILITLSAAQTTLLALVDSATLEITLGTVNPPKIQIENAYSVLNTVC